MYLARIPTVSLNISEVVDLLSEERRQQELLIATFCSSEDKKWPPSTEYKEKVMKKLIQEVKLQV